MLNLNNEKLLFGTTWQPHAVTDAEARRVNQPFNVVLLPVCAELQVIFNKEEKVYFGLVNNTWNLFDLHIINIHFRTSISPIVLEKEIFFSDFISLLKRSNLITPSILVEFDSKLEIDLKPSYIGFDIVINTMFLQISFGKIYNIPVLSLIDEECLMR